MSEDLLEERFTSAIKDESEEYAPFLKVKVPTSKKGDVIASFWSSSKERINPEEVTANCNVSLLIQVNNVWFMNKGFGYGFRLHQAVNYGGGNAFGDQLAIQVDPEDEADSDEGAGAEPDAKRMHMTVE
jgi:hypothetical protein